MGCKNTLCIIGNGFDLHHWSGKAPKTSYEDFGLFLKKNEPETYDLFYKHFPLNGNWSNFETALAELDIENVFNDLINYMDDSNPHLSGEASWEAEKYVNLLTKKMREALRTFIHGEACGRGGIQYPENIDAIQIHLPKNALYLSFNYTHTLEKYYGIPESSICYLHGKADRNEDLIIGHGVNPTTLENSKSLPVMPDNLSPAEQERWYDWMGDQYSFSADQAEGKMEQYWKESFKDTQYIIDDNTNFFQQCELLDKVVIMGHSLSEVDAPYFEEIKKRVSPNACWDISFHSEDEKEHLKNTLLGLGVSDNRINMFKLNDILCKGSSIPTHDSLAKV